MSLFDQPAPPTAADGAATRDLRTARVAVVLLCAAAAVVFSLSRKWPSWSGDYPFFFARAFGRAVALLLLPAAVAAVASYSTRRWHVAFAVAFAAVLGLSVLGSLAR